MHRSSPPTSNRAQPPAIEHYENFPVASLLCPAALRAPISAIYHFARTADDLADEGDTSAAQRLQAIAALRQALELISQAHYANAAPDYPAQLAPWKWMLEPLRQALHQHQLPVALLHDLLDAFAQDVEKTRDAQGYATQAQLYDYCRRSANPIGRLLLHLYGVDQPEALRHSDAICTALQLINFWQDPSIDLPRGRMYFSDEIQAQFGVRRADLIAQRPSPEIHRMLAACVAHARQTMLQGAPLVHQLSGRAGWELRLVVQGGLRILEKIAALNYATLQHRPTLHAHDYALMLWRAAWM